jgi:signal transduction histidine kinase
MISIRWRLTLLLCFAVGALFIVSGIGVFIAIKAVLGKQFDATLTAKAMALITASEIDDGEFEIDLTVQDFAGFGINGDDYFEIRRGDGTVFLRSPSWPGAADMAGGFQWRGHPSAEDTLISDGHLFDGSPARFYVQTIYPKDDAENRFQDLYLIVASPTQTMKSQLTGLASVLAIAGGLGLVLLVPVIRLGLGRGLRPLDRLSSRISAIRPEDLHERLEVRALPAELVPVADRLNEWLGRLEASFDRERRFSSHAAHELRTPLTELKSMAELGAAWPEEATTARFAEMVKVVDEMEDLLDKLSLLARTDAGRQPVEQAKVDLVSSIESAIARFESKARERGLEIQSSVSDGRFTTDPVLWNAILHNILGNAVSHAPAGSVIHVKASPDELVVANPAPDLAAADLEAMFERFWQKDASHSGPDHSGLGMSIIRACSHLLRGTCEAKLTSHGLEVSVMWKSR